MTAVPLFDARPFAVPLPGVWSFWADMIVADVPLGNVDVAAFRCTSKLSGFGNGAVTLALPCGLDPERLGRLWSWRLWAYYDGSPLWCGVPTGVADEDGSTLATLTLVELPGYLQKRVWDETAPRRFDQVEQTAIARILAEPLADVGVPILTDPGPGVLRDRTYEYLESDHRAQLVINLSQVLDGPEFRAEYRTRADGRPECVFRVGYPRVGTDAAGLGIMVPGAALGYRATWDADQLRTKTFAVGDLPENAAEGTPKPVAIQDRPQSDLPRLDAVDDWPGTVRVETLRERAQTMAIAQAAPALALSASPPESYPPLTAYRVGDTVTLRAVTPLVPGGLEVAGRLVQIDVDSAEGRATWTIATSSPPPLARATLARRLGTLDTTLASIFRSGRLTELPPPPELEASS